MAPAPDRHPHPIKVLTDHEYMQYFKTKRMLNQQQTRWSAFMLEFLSYAEYRPGKLGGKPDALTRISGDLPREGDEHFTQRIQTLLKSENLQKPVSIVGAGIDVAQKIPSSHAHGPMHLLADLAQAIATPLEDQSKRPTTQMQWILQMLRDGTRKCKTTTIPLQSAMQEVQRRLDFFPDVTTGLSHPSSLRMTGWGNLVVFHITGATR